MATKAKKPIKSNIPKMAIVGVLSAIAYILMFMEFSVPLMPVFIKMDLSDFPALIGSLAVGAVFILPAGLLYKKKKSKKSACGGAILGAVLMAVVSIVSNYFVVYPVYYNFMPADTILAAYQAIFPGVKSILQSLIVFNMPFTFIKAMISVVITFLVYNHLVPILTMNKRSE